MITLDGLHASYGSVDVLHGIDLEIPEGTIVALLGANGAGKTTLLKAITGLVATRGTITYADERIDGLSTEAIIRRGIGHVPEERGTLMGMTVAENLQVGAYSAGRDAVRGNLERVHRYFPVLAERGSQRAGLLSGGEQQMLAIGRALMSDPRLLLVDELSLGLAPQISHSILSRIEDLRAERDLTVLLVEQNAALAMKVAQYVYVLNLGQIVMHGEPRDLEASDEMRRAYLGY